MCKTSANNETQAEVKGLKNRNVGKSILDHACGDGSPGIYVCFFLCLRNGVFFSEYDTTENKG